MKQTVQVILLNNKGEVLAVSRKDNHNDFGLVGGKVDPEDNDDLIGAAIREAKEETGLDISNLRLVFAMHKNGWMGYTYLADYSGEINFTEPHVVKWTSFNTIIEGSFGKWNQLVSEALDSMGVEYLIDRENGRDFLKEAYKAGVALTEFDWHLEEFHNKNCKCTVPGYNTFEEWKAKHCKW